MVEALNLLKPDAVAVGNQARKAGREHRKLAHEAKPADNAAD